MSGAPTKVEHRARKPRQSDTLPAGVLPLPTYGAPKVKSVRPRCRPRRPLSANAVTAVVDTFEEHLHEARAGKTSGAVLILQYVGRPQAAIGLAGIYVQDLSLALANAEKLARLVSRKIQEPKT